MPEREQKLIRAAKTARLAFPDDESRQAWLALIYGIKNSGERKRMVQSGDVHRLVKVLQEDDWPKLAERLQAFIRAMRPKRNATMNY